MRQVRHQIIGLENETDEVAPILREHLLGRMREILALKEKFTVRQLIHTADDIQHGGFSASGLTEDNQQLSLIYIEVDSAENSRYRISVFEFLGYISQRQNRLLILADTDIQPTLINCSCRKHSHNFADVGILFCKGLFVGSVDKLDASERFITVFQRYTDVGIDIATVNSVGQENSFSVLEHFPYFSFTGGNRVIEKCTNALCINSMEFSISVLFVIPNNRTFRFTDFPYDMYTLSNRCFQIFGSRDDGLDISYGLKVVK